MALFKRLGKGKKDPQKDQQPKQDEQQLVPAQGHSTKEEQGGQVQLHSQHFPPPNIVVNPGNGNGSKNLTVINRFYYKICGFPERDDKKESDKSGIMAYIRSNCLQIFILVLVFVVFALLVGIILSNKSEKLELNSWETVGKILGEVVHQGYQFFVSFIP